MYTVTLVFCHSVALFLLVRAFRSYWEDRTSAHCVGCGTIHRQRNLRAHGGGFKAFCNDACMLLTRED